MLIKKIKLENIRSYLNEEVNFPKGSLVLSGNIGSGKSTILLAVDFVLFGLTRGILSGNALLRNGTEKGSVELHFDLDGKSIIVRRNLKRSKESVVQDTGYISIDNVQRNLSAVELKQVILDLLNYPKELLTKSKSLIYRYTVYTPQEEMKHILMGDKEIRIDTLRKVFGIDKYKRIIENSQIFISKLKEKRKEYTGRIEDLERKKEEKEKKLKKIKEIEVTYSEIFPILSKMKRDVSNKELEFENIQEDVKKFTEINKETEFLEQQIGEKLKRIENDERLIDETNETISKLKSEIKSISEIDMEKIRILQEDVSGLEKREREIMVKLSEFNSKMGDSRKLMNDVYNLENCPTCKQIVDENHKKGIREMETAKIKQLEESSEIYRKDQEGIITKLTNFKQELELYRQRQNDYQINKLKLNNLNDKKGLLNSLMNAKKNVDREIMHLNLRKLDIEKKLNELKDVEETFFKIKKELSEMQENLKQLEIREATLLREKKDLEENVENLITEILNKIKIKDSISELIKVQEWLDGSFNNLMLTMEKQIMLRVHNDFNGLFKKWFDILVENESLNVSLDLEFTPKIEQAGYDIDYIHLSGGEKTAAALAYRLALNQVINNLMSEIKTRDLLILDEPTDGFSDEQLDRMKIVLDELNIKQVIIVSHESKIESFVDNVIKLEKKEHVSRVV